MRDVLVTGAAGFMGALTAIGAFFGEGSGGVRVGQQTEFEGTGGIAL